MNKTFIPSHMVQTQVDPVTEQTAVFAFYEDMLELFREQNPKGKIAHGAVQFVGDAYIATATVVDNDGNVLAEDIIGACEKDDIKAQTEGALSVALKRARANALVAAGFGVPSLQRVEVLASLEEDTEEPSSEAVSEEVAETTEEVVETPAKAEAPEKPKRKRRTKAEMEAARAAEEEIASKSESKPEEVQEETLEASPLDTEDPFATPAQEEKPTTPSVSAKEIVDLANIKVMGRELPEGVDVDSFNDYEVARESIIELSRSQKEPWTFASLLEKLQGEGVAQGHALDTLHWLLNQAFGVKEAYNRYKVDVDNAIVVYLHNQEWVEPLLMKRIADKEAAK